MYRPGQKIIIKHTFTENTERGKQRKTVEQQWEVVRQYRYFIQCKRKIGNVEIRECFTEKEIEEGMKN